jgi:calcium permeable stress-gated cation channel
VTAAVGLALAPAPNYAHYITFLGPLANNKTFTSGLATILAPSFAATVFIVLAVGAVQSMSDHRFNTALSAIKFLSFNLVASRIVPTISVSSGELFVMKSMFYLILTIAVIWLVAAGAILYSFGSLSVGSGSAQAIADGSVYISLLVLAIILNVAFIAPGLLMLQPLHLRRVIRGQKTSVTPRQRFRGVFTNVFIACY